MKDMILVSVGTQKFPLDRLLKRIDELIESGVITQEVFAQIGHSTYRPQHYEYTDFLSKEEFAKRVDECSLLITHSGVSTIMMGVQGRKPVVVFPRLAKYGEHVDDHQMEIAQSFSELNYVLLCNENDDLGETVAAAVTHDFATYTSQREGMIAEIRQFFETI